MDRRTRPFSSVSVSYTHLDVYKRQPQDSKVGTTLVAHRHCHIAGRRESDDGHHILRSRTQTTLLPPARHQRRQLNTLVDNQGADAKRTMDLVSRQGQSVHTERPEIHRNLAQCLHRITMHPAPTLADGTREHFHILDHTGLVVGQHDRNDPGLVRQHAIKGLGVDVYKRQAPHTVG